MTDWYPPEVKPVRVGTYLTQTFDAGWTYDWWLWWDGRMWRDAKEGWALIDQNVTWRGLNEQC